MCRILVSALFLSAALAQEPLTLPPPRTEGGMPLMQALKQRKTTRAFTSEKLSPQLLSDLLWAAFGINRPDGRRTAPSASNRQEIDIYVALAEGLYRYDAKPHRLEPVAAVDLRSGPEAALNLLYVADFAKLTGDGETKAFYSAANTGFISQNVYLFCASAGLGTVVRGGVDRARLAPAMKLRSEQRITLAQTVGYEKK